MKAIFVELPAFAKYRPDYLDDEGLRELQSSLMANPEAGDVVREPEDCGSFDRPTLVEAKASAAACV